MTLPNDSINEPDITTDELLSHLELGCWTAIVLIPLLYYINGPSVSHDQFVVRTILAVVAGVGAPALRVYRWRASKGHSSDVSSGTANDSEPETGN